MLVPKVVTWFKVYAGILAFVYLLVIVLGCFLSFSSLIPSETQEDAMAMKFAGALYIALGLVFGAAFVVGIFSKNQRWAWIYNLVLICLGMSSCLFLPACIPLLIFWVKPETKAWYQRV